MTHMCVDTTAREAAHRGLGVEILNDATGTLTDMVVTSPTTAGPAAHTMGRPVPSSAMSSCSSTVAPS